MNSFKFRLPPHIAACSLVVVLALSVSVSAQSATEPAVPVGVSSQTEVPDGSPKLAQEKVISNTSSGVTGSSHQGRSANAVVVIEERIQGRLASAHVSVGGAKGYTVVDPDVGRADRQSDNGGKRLSPSLWELFRF